MIVKESLSCCVIPSDIPSLVPCLHPFCQLLKLRFLTQLGHGGDSAGNALVWWVHAQLEESSSAQTKQGPEGPEHPETVAIPSLNLSPEEHEPLTTSLLAVLIQSRILILSLSLVVSCVVQTWLVTSIGTRWNKCSKYLAVVAKTEVARTRGNVIVKVFKVF